MRTALLSLAAVLILSGSAAAQTPPPTGPEAPAPGTPVPGSTAGTGIVGAPLRDTTGTTPLGSPGSTTVTPDRTTTGTGLPPDGNRVPAPGMVVPNRGSTGSSGEGGGSTLGGSSGAGSSGSGSSR
jgi:hypothetical protein